MLPGRASALTGADVFVKYENLQVTNSFKERGAGQQARLAQCRTRNRAAVIAMSAATTAQAVAYHARDSAFRPPS